MKKLFLCWMLGAVLFSSAAVVPSGYANPPPSSLAKIEKTGKLFGQNSWVRKHLRAGALALGILITTCTGMSCDNNHKLTIDYYTAGQIVSVTSGIEKTNNVEVVDSLRNDLSSLYSMSPLIGDEEKQLLYAYTLGDETGIGWLLGEANELYVFSRYRGPANKMSLVDGETVKMSLVDGETVDVVPKDMVVGQVAATAYPARDYEYRDPDGTHKSIEIVGRFVSDETSYARARLENYGVSMPLPRYFVLVTHSNGSELANGSKYFTVVETKHLEHLPH